MNSLLMLLASIAYFGAMVVIFYSIYRASKFWPIFLLIEYFYIIGLGLFPILLALDIQSIPGIYTYYRNVDSISELTFAHVILYAFGAIVGFFFCRRFTLAGANRLVDLSVQLDIKPLRFFNQLIIISIVSSLLYFYLIGFERAVLGASASRGGDLSDFAGFEGYVFLRRFSVLGLYAVSVFPYIATSHKKFHRPYFLMALVGLCVYVTSVSRYAFLESILVPMMIYYSYKSRIRIWDYLVLSLTFSFLALVFLFGKEAVWVLANYFYSGGTITFPVKENEASVFDAFSHLIFSVDAGIRSYLRNGPIIPRDVVLSLIGVVPSGLFSELGLSGLSYQFVSDDLRLMCINTKLIAGFASECYMPPYFVGFSAYVLPLAGGFLFGLFRFYIYSIMSRCWIICRGRERLLVVPYLVLLISVQLMLIIPATVSLSVFLSIILFIYLISQRFLLRAVNK